MGRFHTIDPQSEYFQFQSPYVYAANNPINCIDENGEFVFLIPVIVEGVIIVGSAALTAYTAYRAKRLVDAMAKNGYRNPKATRSFRNKNKQRKGRINPSFGTGGVGLLFGISWYSFDYYITNKEATNYGHNTFSVYNQDKYYPWGKMTPAEHSAVLNIPNTLNFSYKFNEMSDFSGKQRWGDLPGKSGSDMPVIDQSKKPVIDAPIIIPPDTPKPLPMPVPTPPDPIVPDRYDPPTD